MRWKDSTKVGSLGWLSWTIVNRHIDTLISTSADAGWRGVSNAGKICDMLESGVVPEFGGGGDSNAKMIKAIEQLTTKDSGYAHLFDSLSPMQRLCLFAAVLAEGRRDERGQPPLNAVIASQIGRYAAELRMKAPLKRLTPVNYSVHLSRGRDAFLKALLAEIAAVAE
ncbi:hypothetical protein [Marinomonas shanghaiensis]|uniref:hypothetical protein n=1 Tax=Marinomonas shanghaiensis TaxID=2202418 RepID=UPI000DB9F4AD|nr:hypothetical protein [Marinomonas shanghaiensis]